MKKKTVKKIASAYMAGIWWAGVREPYFWLSTTNGAGWEVTEARLPLAVRNYLISETLKRGHSWLDSPVVVEKFWLEEL